MKKIKNIENNKKTFDLEERTKVFLYEQLNFVERCQETP